MLRANNALLLTLPPYTTTGTQRIMHPALRIHDIITEIVHAVGERSALTRPTLNALSRVCKTFAASAIDELWYMQRSLLPLILLLKGGAVHVRDLPEVDDDDDENDGFGYDQDFGHTMDVDGISPSAAGEDFFIGDQAVPDEFNADFGADFAGDGDTASVNGSEGAQGDSRPSGPFVPFDPRRVPNERDLILAMTEPGANGSSLDYFDQTFLKNWAGPEHWKLRKVVRRRTSFF